jgi:hypothetical protein
MAKKGRSRKILSEQEWEAAIRVLAGKRNGFECLRFSFIQRLMNHLRGPFKNGMPRDKAEQVLDKLGWKRE